MNISRPIGKTAFHKWAQEIHDKSQFGLRQNEAQNSFVDRTSRGNFSRPRPLFDATPHPVFTVYQSGTWLQFKVTSGYVILNSDPVVPTNTETLITLTSGVLYYWFYIDLSSTPTITTSATTPVWDATKIPIAWVDTSTHAADTRSIVTRYQRFVYNPCSA